MLHGLVRNRGRGLLGRGVGNISALLGLLSAGGVGISLVLAVLLNELGEVLDSAGSGVLDRRVLGAGREDLDGGEALDGLGDVVGGGIDLGDSHLGGEVRVLSVELSELLVLGGETVMELA